MFWWDNITCKVPVSTQLHTICNIQHTALGNPVVPLLKFKYPQTCALVFPFGIRNGGWGWYCCPTSINCWILVKPSALPSNKRTLVRGIPALFAASKATLRDPGRVIRIFDWAVFKACAISSALYAGDAPLTLPPSKLKHRSLAIDRSPTTSISEHQTYQLE